VARGRPTDDPKETLVAVRLADRHIATLERRAKLEGISTSEALRRIVEEWDRGFRRANPPTAAERETFKLFNKALGARSRPRSRK
jgi:hypothetical protein